MTRAELNAAILAAHDAGDGGRLAQLYGHSGDMAEQAGQIDEACFFWVNAFVFALEAGSDSAGYQSCLARYGRENPART